MYIYRKEGRTPIRKHRAMPPRPPARGARTLSPCLRPLGKQVFKGGPQVFIFGSFAPGAARESLKVC